MEHTMILTGLAVGIAFGFVLQRGRFCVTNAFRSVWVARSGTWITAFLLVIAVQAIGVTALTQLDLIHLSWGSLPWLGVIVGGLLFGVSIVLAGGCATGTWFRSGEGLVGSWIALIFYAIGAAAMKHGSLSGVNASVRSFTVPVTTIPALGISAWIPTVSWPLSSVSWCGISCASRLERSPPFRRKRRALRTGSSRHRGTRSSPQHSSLSWRSSPTR